MVGQSVSFTWFCLNYCSVELDTLMGQMTWWYFHLFPHSNFPNEKKNFFKYFLVIFRILMTFQKLISFFLLKENAPHSMNERPICCLLKTVLGDNNMPDYRSHLNKIFFILERNNKPFICPNQVILVPLNMSVFVTFSKLWRTMQFAIIKTCTCLQTSKKSWFCYWNS